MTSLRVTPGQLEALGGTVHRTAADVRSEHQGLKGQLSPLFGADWAGAAASQFEQLYADFDSHARGLAEALDGFGALLERAGASYAQVEQQIAASFR
jgi:WXG100 family type VII secretion target